LVFKPDGLSKRPVVDALILAHWMDNIGQRGIMVLLEFSVVPVGKGESVSQYVAECLKIVASSGLPYKINPMGTVMEGGYDEVMGVVRACHARVMEQCPRVVTTIRIDDRKGTTGAIDRKVEAVEARLGRRLEK
jgi:uncharacterized protein (TIGR00106 family)